MHISLSKHRIKSWPYFPFLIGSIAVSIIYAEGQSIDARYWKSIVEADSTAVQQLLGRGANVNSKDDVGDTPLMYLAWKSNLPLIKLLIKNGANLNILNLKGQSALDIATLKKNNMEVITTLIEAGAHAKSTQLKNCIKLNDPDCVEVLLNHGAPLDSIRIDGLSPINFAHKNKFSKLHELLQNQKVE